MTLRHRLLACTGAALLLCTSAFTASADTTTVTVQVTEPFVDGTFDVGFYGAWFNAIEASETTDVVSAGGVQLFVEDRRGTDAPWEVQYTMGDFTGQSTGGVIPASGMTNQVATIYDNNWNGSPSHDYYSSSLQSFDVATGVWSATGDQTGSYYTYLTGDLTIPAGTAADNYTSTLTVDVTSAP